MYKLLILLILLTGCATETVISHYPNQEANRASAPSFRDMCADPEFRAWANGCRLEVVGY